MVRKGVEPKSCVVVVGAIITVDANVADPKDMDVD